MKDIIHLFESSYGHYESVFLKIFETYPYICFTNCIFFEEFYIIKSSNRLTLKNYDYQDMYIADNKNYLMNIIEENKIIHGRTTSNTISFDDCRTILEETIRKEKLKRLLDLC